MDNHITKITRGCAAFFAAVFIASSLLPVPQMHGDAQAVTARVATIATARAVTITADTEI